MGRTVHVSETPLLVERTARPDDREPGRRMADEIPMRRWLKVFVEAGKAWNADNAFKHSASVAFYTLFSLAPITLIAVGLAGFFFGKDIAAQQFSAQVGQLVGKDSAELVQKTMEANALQGGT